MKSFKIIVLTASILIAQTSMADNAPNVKDFTMPQSDGEVFEGTVKDILIEQQDLYTISPGNTSHATNQTAASGKPPVSIWVNHKNNTYAIGDEIVISAKAVQDGYLTIIDVGTSGEIRQLFPNKYQRNNYLRRGDIIRIPAKNANFHYKVTGPTGTELIKAFLTSDRHSIYGKAENMLNDDVFPLISVNSKALRKDIVTELNNTHQGNWGVYNKVIRIVPATYSSNQAQQPVSAAAAAEQSLKLNKAQIRDIQRFLRTNGYYQGKIDGVIGSQTRQAIRAWQRSAHLPATGYIDAESFMLIMN